MSAYRDFLQQRPVGTPRVAARGLQGQHCVAATACRDKACVCIDTAALLEHPVAALVAPMAAPVETAAAAVAVTEAGRVAAARIRLLPPPLDSSILRPPPSYHLRDTDVCNIIRALQHHRVISILPLHVRFLFLLRPTWRRSGTSPRAVENCSCVGSSNARTRTLQRYKLHADNANPLVERLTVEVANKHSGMGYADGCQGPRSVSQSPF